MQIRKWMAVAIVLAGVQGQALAAGAGNIFIAGNVAYTDGDDTFSDGVARYTLDDNGFGVGLSVGVDITDWLKLQAGWQDLGDFNSTTVVNVTGIPVASEAKVDGFFTGVTVHRGIGSGNLFLYGTLGIMVWDLEFRGGTAFGEDDGSEPYYGFGIGGKIDDHLKWMGGVTRYEIDQVDIDSIGINLLWYPTFINQ